MICYLSNYNTTQILVRNVLEDQFNDHMCVYVNNLSFNLCKVKLPWYIRIHSLTNYTVIELHVHCVYPFKDSKH